jgi:PAS domain S-box-containing protein
MKLKDAPIQKKLMSVILLTCFVVLMLMGSAYIILEYYSYRQNVKSNITTLATVIAANSSASLAFDSPKDATEILKALSAENHIVAACIYDIKGEIFAKYPADTSAAVFPPVQNKNGFWFNDGFLIGFQPITQRDERLGTLFIRFDLEAMIEQVMHYTIVGILLLVGSLVVAFLLSKLLQKSISEPIIALEETAKIISQKRDYGVRAVKSSGNDEVGALTDAFNQMLDQIQLQNVEIMSFNQGLEQKVKERTNDLQHQKEFVETIINSSVDLVAVFDTNLNYIMLNKRADDFYQLKRDGIVGKNILEVFPELKNSGMIEDLQRALKGEYIHNSKYKSPVVNRSFENFYIPLKDKKDVVYGVLTIGHDITNILEANEKLETLNAELIKSNRDLEQFAYIASHDLQEPLRKIQTFTQLLGEYISDVERSKVYQGKISQAAARMQNLIQDVLNFSRISKEEAAFVDTDLNKILENLKTDFELVLQEKKAVINHPVLPVIKGIPLQLSQLFSNIISNSLKYNVNKPVINITCEKLSQKDVAAFAKLNGHAKYIRLNFQDNGIGFEPQFSDRIFNIFQRLHGKQEYSGTGIGLALCKKIVENHHGVIFAHSEPDKGADFTVILPVA